MLGNALETRSAEPSSGRSLDKMPTKSSSITTFRYLRVDDLASARCSRCLTIPRCHSARRSSLHRLFRSLLLTSVALISSSFAMQASAQFAKPEDAIKYRKAAFTVLATHFGRVAAMANGRVPFDAKTAVENADAASVMAKFPYAGFVDGSDKGDTKADPKIWTEMDKFKTAAAKMQEDLVKVTAATKGGNLDALKAAVGETSKSCKSCHDTYRKQ